MKKSTLFTISLLLVSALVFTYPLWSAEEGYWKVTFTADISVYSDGSIPESGGGPIACFAQGYVAAVLYFPLKGGKVIAQNSSVTIEKVTCINCKSEIVSPASDIPIELAAALDVQSVKIGDAEGVIKAVFDDFRIWMGKPVIHPLEIFYDCGPSPGNASDYGNAVSQITSPFLTQVWSFSPQFGEIHSSTFEKYKFPPTYCSDLEFKILEEYVKEIDIPEKKSQ